MEIQIRRHILDIWRATIEHSYVNGKWKWGGRSDRNSIMDAEQLLTILYPATAIDSLSVDSVDEMADDVLAHLRPLGNAMDIPRQLTRFVGEYMREYVVDETPDFSASSYFDPEEPGETVTDGQRRLDVVDSYSISVTLCLATLGFLSVYRTGLKSARMVGEVEELQKLCSQRLTAAMVGLLRSFTVNTFDPQDEFGQSLLNMVNQRGAADEIAARELLSELEEVRAGLRQELVLGLSQFEVADELDNPGRLFECGWSWGVADGAPEVPDVRGIGVQPVGVAEPRPILYFTVVALDGIADLFTERTRILGLLNDEQQRLARALQLRSELTQRFWGTIATFGHGDRWPIEDVPWRTTDGRESDYYSVLLASIITEGAREWRGVSVEANVDRIGDLLEELANRGRITRRPVENDPGIDLHIPGMQLRLFGSEKVDAGPRLTLTVSSYALLVLKCVLRVAEQLENSSDRARFLDLADQIWAHLERRRIERPYARGLWDEPTQVFPGAPYIPFEAPSWYHTERVVEALVAAAKVIDAPPVAADALTANARELLAEAEYLFDREQILGTSDTGMQMRESFQVVSTKLRRARQLLRERPGTASALALDVLRELDAIEAARQETMRTS
jgi:hypothetical protein